MKIEMSYLLLSNPPTKCLGVRWRILAHALGLNLDITSFTLVVH